MPFFLVCCCSSSLRPFVMRTAATSVPSATAPIKSRPDSSALLVSIRVGSTLMPCAFTLSATWSASLRIFPGDMFSIDATLARCSMVGGVAPRSIFDHADCFIPRCLASDPCVRFTCSRWLARICPTIAG